MTNPQVDAGREEVQERFHEVMDEVAASGSDYAKAQFGITYATRLGGISIMMSDREQVEWAMRGAIAAGEAALKAVRADTEGEDE